MARRGEALVELDRVVFDQQLREGAPGGDVWLEVALVHPADRPSGYRCLISTRFTLAEKKVSSTIATVQRRWSKRFGANFFQPGEVNRYVYSAQSETVTRAYGAHSRYGFTGDVGRIYQYLDVIAHAWDWHGPDPQASPRTVRQSILDNAPQLALDLFADTAKEKKSGSGDERPKLSAALVERVGQALGYVSALGLRRVKGRARPAQEDIEKRLLPLVAKILAQKYRKPAATLLRTVVRPTLLNHAFTGFGFESAERSIRPHQSGHRPVKRGRKPAPKRRREPSRKE